MFGMGCIPQSAASSQPASTVASMAASTAASTAASQFIALEQPASGVASAMVRCATMSVCGSHAFRAAQVNQQSACNPTARQQRLDPKPGSDITATIPLGWGRSTRRVEAVRDAKGRRRNYVARMVDVARPAAPEPSGLLSSRMWEQPASGVASAMVKCATNMTRRPLR
jgi:hypothetical protein